jgi:hypothetical protein
MRSQLNKVNFVFSDHKQCIKMLLNYTAFRSLENRKTIKYINLEYLGFVYFFRPKMSKIETKKLLTSCLNLKGG